jgi:uncharacterized membrane protein YfcA
MIHSVGAGVTIAAAGMAAGAINTVVGSGTLITFPTLLAFGVPPVTANVSNSWGVMLGSLSGTWGYRRELAGQGGRVARLAVATVIGSVIGAVLLLALPATAFRAIVPVLIALGVILVISGPWITRRLHTHDGPNRWLWPAVLAVGIYCGYFGAAQGVILIAILSIGINDTLQRLNGVKNVLATLGNGVAAVMFMFLAHIDWEVAGLIGAGALVGGQLGATYGRRLSPTLLRAFIATVGIVALVALLV